MSPKKRSADEAVKSVYQGVDKCLREGQSPKQIESSLVEAGIDLETASTVVQNAVQMQSATTVLGNPTSGEPTVPIFQKDITKKHIIQGLILVALGVGLELYSAWDRSEGDPMLYVGMVFCGIGIAYCAKAKGRSLWWSALTLFPPVGPGLYVGIFHMPKPKSIIMKRIERAAEIVIIMVLAAVIWIILVQFSNMRTREYDAAVRADLIFAARAQETYFTENGRYTNSVSDLRNILSGAGISHSSNVHLTIEATTTTFVISGNVNEGCTPNTGTWFLNSTTGAIDGTPCR